MTYLLFAENTLAAAWFGEIQADWSKKLFVYQDLVRDNKNENSIIAQTPTLGNKIW